MRWRILIVDDDEAMLRSCEKVLSTDGHEVSVSTDPLEGCRMASENDYDLLIIDLKMPKMSGIQFMREVRKLRKDLPIILITAFATMESAVRAVTEGAYDYIPKPFSAEHLSYTVNRCMEYKRAVAAQGVATPREVDFFDGLVGNNATFQQAIATARKVAELNVNVLLQGESGTGKELFARGLHETSARHSNPFVVVDCAALPESLMESELYGYEPGAFTGATRTKLGLFEAAHRGTVFFDEIGNVSLSIQAKLLRTIEERTVKRLGGLKILELDIRIISATNKDLRAMILDDDFRDDLFYRLNVVPIHLPPLRERKEDIPLLANHFVREFTSKSNISKPLSSAATMALERYHWPGNIRELKNTIEHAASVASSNQITPLDLPPHLIAHQSRARSNLAIDRIGFQQARQESIQSFEKDYLGRMLELTGGNVTRASRIAKIARTRFHTLMNKYGLRSGKYK